MSNAKKYIIAGVLVLAVVIYLVFANSRNTSVTSTAPENTSTDTTSTGATAGQYKDGTYTGSVENAVYGNIQVVATISGGKITAVNVPVAPSAPGHTDQVTASAIPVLQQEALTVQGANVNIVSGATQDSEAFQQSLASALAQAGQS
jgi:uncharacterized protein with FMN-binding domain